MTVGGSGAGGIEPTAPGFSDYVKVNKFEQFLFPEKARLNAMKQVFYNDFARMIKQEEEYCKRTGSDVGYATTHKQEIENLVEQVKDIYELEAFARFLFDENTVPTYEQIRARGEVLRTMYALGG